MDLKHPGLFLPVDIDEVAARVSAQLEVWSPAFTRCVSVARGANGTILNLERSTAVAADGFWPTAMVVDEQANREMYWGYRRSNGCDRSVAFLAASLKELVDRGVDLVHGGNPVRALHSHALPPTTPVLSIDITPGAAQAAWSCTSRPSQ